LLVKEVFIWARTQRSSAWKELLTAESR